MPLLNFIYVCPNCKQMSKNLGGCPNCGTQVISTNYTIKAWEKLTPEKQQELIEKVIGTVSKEGLETLQMESFVTTTNHFDTAEIEKYLGTVSGTDIYLVGGIVGGGLANQENLFGRAFSFAKIKMIKKAFSLGGNAVVGMSVSLASAANNILVVVTGTAVKLKGQYSEYPDDLPEL